MHTTMTLQNPSRRRLLNAATAVAALPAGLPLLAQAQSPRTLKVVSPWEISTLDPSKAGYILARLEVAETLVEVNDQGLLAPGLASSWTTSSDKLE